MKKKKEKKEEVTFQIHWVYGFLNEEKTKALVRVSWNGGEARNEIRRCHVDKRGKIDRLWQGLALSDEEGETLAALISDISGSDGKREKRVPVDFDAEFERAEQVMREREKR